MLQVNLLPWRKTYRQRRYRAWRALALVSIATEIALMLLFSWRYRDQLRLDEARQSSVTAYHAALEAQAGAVNRLKKDLQQAEHLALQGQRRFDSSLRYAQRLQHLSQSMPSGAWVTQLHQNGGHFRLGGQAQDYSEVLALSQALRREDLLPQVQMHEVRLLAASALSFSLNAPLENP